MTTKEFLTQMEATSFTDQAKHFVRASIGDEPEFTPEIKATIHFLLQNELETGFELVLPSTA